jgi:diguanylate cyclase (GGDEF)-like protein
MLNDGQTPTLFINLKPRFGFERDGEGPLSGGDAPCCQGNGDCRGGNAPGAQAAGVTTGETGPLRPRVSEMLSVPTLWTVFVINLLALGLIWAYVVRSYPAFAPARFWTGSSFVAAAGAALATLRVVMTDSLVPLLVAGTSLIFAIWIATMGIQKFFDRPADWRLSLLVTGLACAGMFFFTYGYDSGPGRLIVFAIGQMLPLIASLKLLLSREGRANPGAGLAGIIAVLIIGIFIVRSIAAATGFSGGFSYAQFTPLQSVVVLALVFLSMAWNFGFLLMAMDRLRNEVADLALLDDLTGVGNRRHLVQRLTEECARSERNGQPFALLVIDLDGFKAINDTHGHAAGDACLRHFTLMAQTRLRPGDMLARSGGDEFCIVLPASTLREGAMIARRILEVCRQDAAACVGADIPIALSIGVAQWTREIGAFPDRLMAAADHALYAAKNDGKNRYAVYDPAPPLVPPPQPMPELALRKQA